MFLLGAVLAYKSQCPAVKDKKHAGAWQKFNIKVLFSKSGYSNV